MLPQLHKQPFKPMQLLLLVLLKDCLLPKKLRLKHKLKLKQMHNKHLLVTSVMLLQPNLLKTKQLWHQMLQLLLRPPSHIQEPKFNLLKVKQLHMLQPLLLLPMLCSKKKNHGQKWPQLKDNLNSQRTKLKRKPKKKRMKEKTQLSMKMENISKPLLRLKPKLLNFNKCWLQVKQPLSKRSY